MAARVPVVDLRRYRSKEAAERAAFVREFGDALRTFGFVRVHGHDVGAALVKRAYALFEELFALDASVKRRYEKTAGGQRGYVGFGKEHAKDQAVGDLKEFWHVGRELAVAHPLASVYPLNVWPAELPALRPVALELYAALESSAEVMLEALAEYLALDRGAFRHMTLDGNSILRAIHYPPMAAGFDPRAVRAAAHEDINLITLLCEATTSGLEIRTRDGDWLPIDSLEGQIIADAGDMLARVTNERIPSTTHRVVNPAGGRNDSRYSLPFFVHPQPGCVLECLPGCDTEDNPKRYPPIAAKEFLRQRLIELGLLEKSILTGDDEGNIP